MLFSPYNYYETDTWVVNTIINYKIIIYSKTLLTKAPLIHQQLKDLIDYLDLRKGRYY